MRNDSKARVFFPKKLETLVIIVRGQSCFISFKLSLHRLLLFFFFATGVMGFWQRRHKWNQFAHLKKYQLSSFITKSFIFILKHEIGSATGQCLVKSTIYIVDRQLYQEGDDEGSRCGWNVEHFILLLITIYLHVILCIIYLYMIIIIKWQNCL